MICVFTKVSDYEVKNKQCDKISSKINFYIMVRYFSILSLNIKFYQTNHENKRERRKSPLSLNFRRGLMRRARKMISFHLLFTF